MRAFTDIIGPGRIAAMLALGAVSTVSVSALAGPAQEATPSAGTAKVDVAALRDSANAGDAQAMFTLGKMHAYGRVVPEDDSAAVEWFTRAAAAGHAPALTALGAHHANGEGVASDDA
ncbi:MAG: Sel1 repeat, partial [Planctomycetota bacterium]